MNVAPVCQTDNVLAVSVITALYLWQSCSCLWCIWYSVETYGWPQCNVHQCNRITKCMMSSPSWSLCCLWHRRPQHLNHSSLILVLYPWFCSGWVLSVLCWFKSYVSSRSFRVKCDNKLSSTSSHYSLVVWHSGRTSVFGRPTFRVLRSTCS